MLLQWLFVGSDLSVTFNWVFSLFWQNDCPFILQCITKAPLLVAGEGKVACKSIFRRRPLFKSTQVTAKTPKLNVYLHVGKSTYQINI